MAAHTCNPWCQVGANPGDRIHAVLFDTQISERGNLDAVARAVAGMVGEYAGFQEVNPPGIIPGTPGQHGVQRGRVVAWARSR